MKKIITTLLALALLVALAVPALAVTMYVSADSAKVYKKDSKDSKVISRLPLGGAIDVFETNGNWYHINYINKHGVQKSGWMQAKNLSNSPVHKHTWGPWRVGKHATCTEDGYKERTCTGCGKKQTKEIKRTGHDWGSWKVTREATCVDEGTRVRTCKNCDKKQTKSYLADHTYGGWNVISQPTCTEKGLRERACQVCGHREEQSIDKLPHDYAWNVIVEPTDHSAGVRAKVCQICGLNGGQEDFDPEGTLRRKDKGEAVRQLQQLLVDQGYLSVGAADGSFGGGTEKAVMQFQRDQGLNPDGVAWPQTIKRLSHDFGPWETVRAMTRTTPGERRRVCNDCGYEQYETVEMGDVIERGARGENVRAIQQILKQVGYDAGGFDGIYGQKLDRAFAQFDAAHGLTFAEGRVRPADVDALVSAWLAQSGAPLTESGVDTPVNLALSVTPASDETTDSDVTTYSWTLHNLGAEECMFNALLLTYGDTPDFNGDDLVMVIDGKELKGYSGNSLSGSFSVAGNWGAGSLNFAAMAVSENTGVKWLSNVVTFEVADADAPKTVAPQAVDIDVNHLEDGVYPVAFDRGDVMKGASGIYMNAVHIYTEDWYDIVDINTLKPGDSIVVNGETVEVQSVEPGDPFRINGGSEADGVDLVAEEDTNGYRFCGDDDISAYTEQGVVSLVVDPSATFTDGSDIESEPVSVDYDRIVDAMLASDNEYFGPYNTTVRIEGGRVVEINRQYMP